MLVHLSIRHFAIVENLEVELGPGMTAITGETGAGKSIMLDALGLALGSRADSSVVQAGQARADITAALDLRANAQAQEWLLAAQLDHAEADECLVRRVIGADGRSRAWINGQPVTLQQLKAFGQLLADIHAQHEHQSLLVRETHHRLLDAHARAAPLSLRVRQLFGEWQACRLHLAEARQSLASQESRCQLLRYQVDELDQLGLESGELAALEAEQLRLAHADDLLQTGQQVLDLCQSGDRETASVSGLLARVRQMLAGQKVKSPALVEAAQLFESADIQIEEACREIERHQASVEIDPARLAEVERRLSQIYQIARKHRVAPDLLPGLLAEWRASLQDLSGGEAALEQQEQECNRLESAYREAATQLGDLRRAAAATLAVAVNRELRNLNMAGCRFDIVLEPQPEPSPQGLEQVEFRVATNPGQPLMPLKKVASGGELSRLCLAIQVVAAQSSSIPTLVFDEVDVGIGGETAAIVGQLLRRLGERGQVLCVTHQAQVASRAHQHLFVTKAIYKNAEGKRGVKTALMQLGEQDRINEVARMIGGQQTPESRAHAEAMLKAG